MNGAEALLETLADGELDPRSSVDQAPIPTSNLTLQSTSDLRPDAVTCRPASRGIVSTWDSIARSVERKD
jgi:hypothetical protein